MFQVVDRHLQQHVQLVLGHHHPQPVAGVHHEDDALQGGHVKGDEGEEEHVPGSLCSSAPTGSCTCPDQTCQRQ